MARTEGAKDKKKRYSQGNGAGMRQDLSKFSSGEHKCPECGKGYASSEGKAIHMREEQHSQTGNQGRQFK